MSDSPAPPPSPEVLAITEVITAIERVRLDLARVSLLLRGHLADGRPITAGEFSRIRRLLLGLREVQPYLTAGVDHVEDSRELRELIERPPVEESERNARPHDA